MMTAVRRSPALVVGVLVGIAIGAAEVMGGGPGWRAGLSTAIPIGYALIVTVLSRRSETAGVLAGRPVDERWELMNQEAAAWALGLSAIVILAGFIVADASGGDQIPYALIGGAMAVAYAGSLGVIRLRG
jgi:hypothetical protein